MGVRRLLQATLLTCCLAGCSDPPPPKSGVDIQAPGVRVKVDDNNVKVKAPGADVNTKKNNK